jgi:hypothetical protein
MKNHRYLPALAFALAISIAVPSASALRKNATWGKQTRVKPDAEAGGWFINLGITGVRAKILLEQPREFEVAYVFADTPAAGKLEVGDKITGANGVAFSEDHKFGYGPKFFGYEGPMMEFGLALERSQGELKGKLALQVVRGGKAMQVDVALPTKYGSFSKTFPYDCAKTDKILDESFAYLIKTQRDNGTWGSRPDANAFAALALMGGGKKYMPAVKRAVKTFAEKTDDQISYGGLDGWKYTLYGTVLGEYYLITREDWVLPELEEIKSWLLKAQMENGGWGHRPANKPGGNGYGAINAITMQAKLALALIMRCGIEVDAEKFRATHDFVARGTNDIGYVWYKDGGRRNKSYADMGRTGITALAHYVSPVGGEEYRDFALLTASCIGANPKTFPDTHGSPLLGLAWTGLGAQADPEMFRKLMDYNRWHFSMAHCTNGTFYYQPNRDNNPQDFAAPRLSATATTAFVLSIKHKSLRIMGGSKK